MIKLLTAILAVLAGASYAHAEFHATPPADMSPFGAFECVPISETSKDADHVYKIAVVLTGDKDRGELTDMNVEHTTISGKVYNRSEQFAVNQTLVYHPGHLEYQWTGTLTTIRH